MLFKDIEKIIKIEKSHKSIGIAVYQIQKTSKETGVV